MPSSRLAKSEKAESASWLMSIFLTSVTACPDFFLGKEIGVFLLTQII
jgi:hypothetical protein